MSDTIIRAKHGESEAFFIAARATAQDEGISYEALGLLMHLLSKPNDWRIYPKRLGREKCGRDKVYRLLQELINAGYVERQIERGQFKQFTGSTYIVYERPTPRPEKPDTVIPDADEPDTATADTLHNRDSSAKPPRQNQRSSHSISPPPPSDVMDSKIQLLKNAKVYGKARLDLAERFSFEQVERVVRYAEKNGLRAGWIVTELDTNGEGVRDKVEESEAERWARYARSLGQGAMK